jgi:Tfp pilus assembly protein PilN
VSQQINLFNPIFLKQRKVFSAVAMARALAVLLGGVLAVAFIARQSVEALQKEANDGRERLVQREARINKVNGQFLPREKSGELETELAQAEARIKAMREVAGVLQRGELGNANGYSEYFKALARQNPSGVWLTGVTIGGPGNELGVQGRALDPALVPAYLGRLQHEQVMRGKAFGSLKISQPAAGKDGAAAVASFVEFSLESTLAEDAQ